MKLFYMTGKKNNSFQRASIGMAGALISTTGEQLLKRKRRS